MSLETELKKNTAALVALNETLNGPFVQLAEQLLNLGPQNAPTGAFSRGTLSDKGGATTPDHPGQPIPAEPRENVPLTPPHIGVTTTNGLHTPTPPAPPPTTPTPPPQPAAPVHHTPPATAAPAEDDARKKLVAWAQTELGKIQHTLGPQRLYEMVQAEGVEKLSDITSDRLPQFVVQAQNEAATIQASGGPQ